MPANSPIGTDDEASTGDLPSDGGRLLHLRDNSAENAVGFLPLAGLRAEIVSLLGYGFQAFGILFCLQWLAAIGYFPFMKDRLLGLVPACLGSGCGAWLAWKGVPGWLWKGVVESSRNKFLTLLFAMAGIARVAAVLHFPWEPLVDDAQLHRYAVNMLTGGAYGSELYRAFFPPGMSFLLTAWYWLTTPHPLAGKMLNVMAGLAMTYLTWRVGRSMVREATARWAAVYVALSPTLVFYTATLGYEIVLGALLLAMLALVLRPVASKAIQLLQTLALGLMIGGGILIKPICLLLPAIWGGWQLAVDRRWPGVVVRWAAVVCIAGLVVAPWTYRNYRVFGEWVLVSTNGGVTLYTANNPESQGIAMAIRPARGEVDEVTRDRICKQKAIDWIVQNPLDWAWLSLRKMTYLWGTSSSIMSVISVDRLSPRIEAICMGWINVFWAALWPLFAVATFKTDIWRRWQAWPALLLVAYVWGIHLFYESMSRHHVPLIPILALVAAAGLRGARTEPASSLTSAD